MAEDGLHREHTRKSPPKELVVRFWTLVLLAKFGIMLIGVGIPVAIFTEFRTAGVALVLIGVVIGIRWAQVYRRARARLDRR